MKLTILGNHGPYPPAGGACSSYLIESGKLGILIDMGSGSLAELQKKRSIFDIDIIILTHLHFDHMVDIQILKYAYGVNGYDPEKKPVLMLPAAPENIHEQIIDGRFEVKVLRDGMEFAYGGIDFTFYKVPHPVECYAVQITDGRSRFVFSGDTYDAENIAGVVQGADLFLVDAGLIEKDKTAKAPHFTVAEACRAGRAAKRTLLTHFSPKYTKEEIASEVGFGAELSEQGKEYEF